MAERSEGCIHTHLAQSRDEVEWVRARDGSSPVELLEECGLLDARLIAAHCIFLDPPDIARAGANGLTVAHAPIGNLRAGNVAPVLDLEAAGARIALCTDTMSGDLFEAMRTAIAAARVGAGGGGSIENADLDARKALGWATRGGAAALGLGDRIGSIEPGKKADLVLLDPAAPSLAPVVDGYGIVVHSGVRSRCRHGDRRWSGAAPRRPSGRLRRRGDRGRRAGGGRPAVAAPRNPPGWRTTEWRRTHALSGRSPVT